MVVLAFLAIICGTNPDVTLKSIMSIERFEHGTNEERVQEIDNALESIHSFARIIPTPDEYRVLAAGLRHENPVVRAGSAALMKKIFSEPAGRIAAGLASSRREQLNARGHVTSETLSPYPIEYQKDDDEWFKCCYYLVNQPEIPGADAYQGFQKNSLRQGGRCVGLIDSYRSNRKEFDFYSHLQTKDLATLQYALSRQIEVFERQLELPSLTQIESERIANIMNYCPCERTKSLAKKIFEMTKAKEPTAKQ